MIQKMAFVGGIVLPLFNIPLIARLIKRKSSNDISISWAIGVWSCLLLIAPYAIASGDVVWKVYNLANLVLFTGVLICVLAYRRR